MRRLFLPLWLTLFLYVPPAMAQGPTTGAIRGEVVDVGGAALPGAIIAVEELATHRRSAITTAADGTYTALALTPGLYQISAVASGFAPASAQAQVPLGGEAVLTLRLLPAGVSTSVDVSPDAGESALGDGTPVQADIIGPATLAQLPLDGRRWQSFARLTPQANPVDAEASLLSFSGLAPSQNSTRLDGVSDDSGYTGVPRGNGPDSGPEVEDETEDAAHACGSQGSYASGIGTGRQPGMAYTFSEAAVREFRVTGQNDSAVYGHAAGGVITTVSRSGTEDRHGSVFYLVRSSALAAGDPFAIATHYRNGVVTTGPVQPHDLRQQFGGTFGGPLIPEKLFVFYALDVQRRGFPGVATPGSPTFYNLSATQRALLSNRGVTASKTEAALNHLDSLTGLVDRRQDQTVNFGKLDWQPGERDRFSLEENRARSSSPAGGRTAAVVNRGRGSFGDAQMAVDAVIGRWIHTLNAHLVSELRGQYGRDLHIERPQPPLAGEPAIGPGGFAPEVIIGPSGLIFGTPPSAGGGPAPEEHRLQAAELLTYTHDRHLLQVGADWSRVADHIRLLTNAEGTFHYDSGTTNGHAGGLVDWITDYTFGVNSYPNGACPSINALNHFFCFRTFTQSFGGAETRFNTGEWAGFVQDDWRVRKGLTVSAGLRYEYELLPLPQRPNLSLDRVFGKIGATNSFPEDRNNLGPRFGVALQPFGSKRTTLRAGYGLYFGRLPGATVRAALTETALPSTTSKVRITPQVEAACPQAAAGGITQGFGYPCAFLTTPPDTVLSTTSAVLFDHRFRLPTSQQATFSAEHELRAGTLLRASYRMNLTRQLPSSTDINIAPATGTTSFILVGGRPIPGVRPGETFALPVYTARIDTAYGPVTDIVSNVNASYHALLLEATTRTRRGLTAHASWTWSKSIDYGGSSGSVPATNGQLDPFNNRFDKALSSNNIPHKLVATAVWAPAVASTNRLRRALLVGWSVAPIVTESSGRPYSYDIFGGTRLPGGHESLNGSGGAVYLPTVGRDVLRLPDRIDANLRLGRELPVAEHARLRLTAEIFNLPNHRNLTAVNQRAFLAGTPANGYTPLTFQDAATVAAEGLNTEPFGSSLAARASQAGQRQIQLGARLEF